MVMIRRQFDQQLRFSIEIFSILESANLNESFHKLEIIKLLDDWALTNVCAFSDLFYEETKPLLQFFYPISCHYKGFNQPNRFQLRCIARNVVAICSFKPRDSSQPNFVALVPHIERAEDVAGVGHDDSASQGIPKGFLVCAIAAVKNLDHHLIHF